ncbi:MAG: DUF2933 domain-containing protein [Bacillota bacterium]
MSFSHGSHNQNSSGNTSESKKQMIWLPWLLVAVLGGMVMYYYFGLNGKGLLSSGGLTWFPVLMSLICPIMMLYMMGMGHSHHGGNQNQNGHSGHGGCCGGEPANKAPEK